MDAALVRRRTQIGEHVATLLDMPTGPDVRLHAVVTGLLGRRVTNQEIAKALGFSKTRYYEVVREDSAQLLRADRLIRLARQLGINPFDLLVRLGLLEITDVKHYVDTRVREARAVLGLVDEPGHVANDAE